MSGPITRGKRPRPKIKKTTANYRPPSNSAVSRKKPKSRPKRSLASRLRSGIAGIGSRIKSDFKEIRDNVGKPKSEQSKSYRDKTAATKKKHDEAVARSKKRRKKRRLRAEREAAKQNPQTPTPTPTPPDGGLPSIPRKPKVTPEMRRAALEIFESQQGAGQVPYYMAAARNAQNPNMSPAFQYAAQNYDVLGGAQRLAPRPMEMMSVAERQQINRMAEGMANPPQIGPPRFGFPGIPRGPELPTGLGDRVPPSPQKDYQQGMNMVMRGGGKGGPATGQQSMPPQGLAALLAQRFGGFGGQ